MKSIKSFLVALVFGVAAASSNAAVITEEYTGRQFVAEGDTFVFDFDLWYRNVWPVNDNSALTLSTDGQGAFGPWSSATLYIDFYSTDLASDFANIDLDAWGFWGPWGSSTDILTLSAFNVSRSAGSPYYNFSYSLTPAQLGIFDNYGWGTVSIGATRRSNLENDFDLTRVGMRVSTVPEPGTLTLLGLGLAGLAFASRRRRST